MIRYKFYDTVAEEYNIANEFFEDNHGECVEVAMPSKFVVCSRCDGRGVHDCWEGGMTSDEMHEQGPDFVDDYFSGVYDTRCTVCDGLRVIEVVDVDRVPGHLRAAFNAQEQENADYAAELAWEQRMRASGREW